MDIKFHIHDNAAHECRRDPSIALDTSMIDVHRLVQYCFDYNFYSAVIL